MLSLQGLAVQPLLGHAFPGDDPAAGRPDFVIAHHLLQKIFSTLFLLRDGLQPLTGFVILCQQISGGVW